MKKNREAKVMEENVLCVIPGSRHSKEAEEYLDGVGIPFKKIVLNNRDLLSAAPFDLGVSKAPALYMYGKWYEGLSSIRELLRSP